jgi:hypothetical protein
MFKRIEVWILMLLSLAAIAFVYWPDKATDDAIIVQTANANSRLQLLGASLERDHGNARLDLRVRLVNREPQAVRLIEPFVRLLADKGREVPLFFLPTEPPALITEKSEATLTLRFWLEKADLQSALTLQAGGERTEVKTSAPVDLLALPNMKSVTLTRPIWVVGPP